MFATAYGVVDGTHVIARVEYQTVGGKCVRGVTYYRSIQVSDVQIVTTTGQPISGDSFMALSGFALVVFTTAFGLTWAFIRGHTHT